MRFVAGTHTYFIPCCHACGSACQGLHGLIVEHSWKFNGNTMLQILVARGKRGCACFGRRIPSVVPLSLVLGPGAGLLNQFPG